MAKTVNNKLVDSSEKVSLRGRAESFWKGKPIKPSSKYEAEKYTGLTS